MIPMIGLMIWAYGVARLLELTDRRGDAKPSKAMTWVIAIMIVVMCFSCVGLQVSGVKP
jgi:phosphate/sulfate permease